MRIGDLNLDWPLGSALYLARLHRMDSILVAAALGPQCAGRTRFAGHTSCRCSARSRRGMGNCACSARASLQ
jgi:hypothetical protein